MGGGTRIQRNNASSHPACLSCDVSDGTVCLTEEGGRIIDEFVETYNEGKGEEMGTTTREQFIAPLTVQHMLDEPSLKGQVTRGACYESPTSSPTDSPTLMPTSSPTPAPTKSPTQSPTQA